MRNFQNSWEFNNSASKLYAFLHLLCLLGSSPTTVSNRNIVLQVYKWRRKINRYKSNLHFRFLYVRNASGLVKDKAKLLHMIILIFTLTYHFNRIGIWVVAQLATGLNYELIPLGKYCMMTNISLTWHGELDQDFPQRATSNRMQVMVSMALFSIALTYVCLGALVAR